MLMAGVWLFLGFVIGFISIAFATARKIETLTDEIYALTVEALALKQTLRILRREVAGEAGHYEEID